MAYIVRRVHCSCCDLLLGELWSSDDLSGLVCPSCLLLREEMKQFLGMKANEFNRELYYWTADCLGQAREEQRFGAYLTHYETHPENNEW